jgi:hypothetical protein
MVEKIGKITLDSSSLLFFSHKALLKISERERDGGC